MNTKAWKYLGACVLLLGAANAAPAAVLYSQPLKLPLADRGPFSEVGGQEIADQFVLAQNGTINGLSLLGSYQSGDLNPFFTTIDFHVSFFSDAAGIPGSQLGSTQTVTAAVSDLGLTFEGRKIYGFTGALQSSLNVLASTTTWVSILEFSNNAGFRWATGVGPNATAAVRQTSFGAWSNTTTGERVNLAFDLLGDFEQQPEPIVPEPSSLALMALGVCGMIGYQVRRRRV